MKLIFELDCDGVIADIYTPAERLVRERYKEDIIYNQFNFNMVRDWGMTSLNKDVRDYIFELFSDAEYISNLQAYQTSIEGLKILNQLAIEYNFGLCVNTAAYSKKVAIAKEAWLLDLKAKTRVDFEYKISEVTIGYASKPRPDNKSIVIVEDNLTSIRASPAKYCYIIHHTHNAENTNKAFADVFNKSKRVANLLEVGEDLKLVLERDWGGNNR